MQVQRRTLINTVFSLVHVHEFAKVYSAQCILSSNSPSLPLLVLRSQALFTQVLIDWRLYAPSGIAKVGIGRAQAQPIFQCPTNLTMDCATHANSYN